MCVLQSNFFVMIQTVTEDGMHRDTYGSDTTDISILPESTHTSSGTDINDIISLSLSSKSGAKLVAFLAIYII